MALERTKQHEKADEIIAMLSAFDIEGADAIDIFYLARDKVANMTAAEYKEKGAQIAGFMSLMGGMKNGTT